MRIILLFLFINYSNCATMKFSNGKISKPISYHNAVGEKIQEFEDTYTNWYWFGFDVWGNKDFDEVITEKLNAVPEAKGIRNFSYRIYNRSYYYPSLFPNPTSFITWHLNYLGYFFGITNKGVYIKGELYKWNCYLLFCLFYLLRTV